jgi:hypothetical protein
MCAPNCPEHACEHHTCIRDTALNLVLRGMCALMCSTCSLACCCPTNCFLPALQRQTDADTHKLCSPIAASSAASGSRPWSPLQRMQASDAVFAPRRAGHEAMRSLPLQPTTESSDAAVMCGLLHSMRVVASRPVHKPPGGWPVPIELRTQAAKVDVTVFLRGVGLLASAFDMLHCKGACHEMMARWNTPHWSATVPRIGMRTLQGDLLVALWRPCTQVSPREAMDVKLQARYARALAEHKGGGVCDREGLNEASQTFHKLGAMLPGGRHGAALALDFKFPNPLARFLSIYRNDDGERYGESYPAPPEAQQVAQWAAGQDAALQAYPELRLLVAPSSGKIYNFPSPLHKAVIIDVSG